METPDPLTPRERRRALVTAGEGVMAMTLCIGGLDVGQCAREWGSTAVLNFEDHVVFITRTLLEAGLSPQMVMLGAAICIGASFVLAGDTLRRIILPD